MMIEVLKTNTTLIELNLTCDFGDREKKRELKEL